MSMHPKQVAPVLALLAALAACGGGSVPSQSPEAATEPTASASPGGGTVPSAAPSAPAPPPASSDAAPSGGAATPQPSDAPSSPGATYEPEVAGRVYVSIDGVEVGWVAIVACFRNPDGSLTVVASDEHGVVSVVGPDPIPGQIAGTVNGHDFAVTEGGYANGLDGDIGTFGGVDGVTGSKITGRFNCP